MVVVKRDEYNHVTLKVAWGKKTVQRGLLVKEIRPDVFAGYITFHNEATAGFVWNSKKHDLPWISGKAQKCETLQKAIVAAIKRAA